MPLIKGKSQKVIGKNIAELTRTKPSKARAKGIATLAKRRGIPFERAKQVQAQAIAYAKAGKSRGQITSSGAKANIPNRY